MTRPSWDRYFLDMACNVAARSTCNRAHVGALLVRDNRVLATGFNGSVRNLPHCDEAGHLMIDGHCKRTIHAEINAVIQCALHGVSSQGATAYITHYPCYDCSKVLLNAGIARVVYAISYGNTEHGLFLASNVDVECLQ